MSPGSRAKELDTVIDRGAVRLDNLRSKQRARRAGLLPGGSPRRILSTGPVAGAASISIHRGKIVGAHPFMESRILARSDRLPGGAEQKVGSPVRKAEDVALEVNHAVQK